MSSHKINFYLYKYSGYDYYVVPYNNVDDFIYVLDFAYRGQYDDNHPFELTTVRFNYEDHNAIIVRNPSTRFKSEVFLRSVLDCYEWVDCGNCIFIAANY